MQNTDVSMDETSKIPNGIVMIGKLSWDRDARTWCWLGDWKFATETNQSKYSLSRWTQCPFTYHLLEGKKSENTHCGYSVKERTGPKLIEPLQVSGNWRGVFSSIQGECIHSIIAENFTINMRHSNDKNIYVVEAVGENQFGPFRMEGKLNNQSGLFKAIKRYCGDVDIYDEDRKQLTKASHVSTIFPYLNFGSRSISQMHRFKVDQVTTHPIQPKNVTMRRSAMMHVRLFDDLSIPDYLHTQFSSSGIDSSKNKLEFLNTNGEVYNKALIFSNGEIFDGMNVDGERHGYGVCCFPSGIIYEGTWVNGKMSGRGILWRSNGSLLYAGDIYNDIITGFGIHISRDGSKYKGEFKDNMRHGHGRQMYSDGRVYEGSWVRNKPHGFGVIVDKDGSSFSGEWNEGVFDGKGVATIQSFGGSISKGRTFDMFSGTFHSGKICGRGRCMYRSGDSYEGMWRESLLHGRGTYTFSDNSSYEGRFSTGLIRGAGTLSLNKGMMITHDSEHLIPFHMSFNIEVLHRTCGYDKQGQ